MPIITTPFIYDDAEVCVQDTINVIVKELRKEINELKDNSNKFIKMTCYNCGGSISQKIDNHLVKCPYCKTAYFVGTNLVNLLEY